MPDEEHPLVSSGRSQWEGVSDAEAAVVFNQGTGGPLQLHAQQAVRKVIITPGHPNWSKTLHEVTLFPSTGRLDFSWVSFCSHRLTVSLRSSSLSVRVSCFGVWNALLQGGTDFLYIRKNNVFMKSSKCMRLMYVIAHDKLAVIYILIYTYIFIVAFGFYCFELKCKPKFARGHCFLLLTCTFHAPSIIFFP